MYRCLRFSKWDYAVAVLALAVISLWGNQPGNAACNFRCDDVIYFTTKIVLGDTTGSFYKVTSATTCHRVWHTDAGDVSKPIAGGSSATRKYKEVACTGGITVHCFSNGGVDGKCSTCAGNEILGGTEYDISCWEKCKAYPMP